MTTEGSNSKDRKEWRLNFLKFDGKEYFDAKQLIRWLDVGGYSELVTALENCIEKGEPVTKTRTLYEPVT